MNDDEARETLTGIGAARPLPQELRDELALLLSGHDPVARLASAAGADDAVAVPVPSDLSDRLHASLAAGALPSPLRRRLERVLPSGAGAQSRLMAIAAVATAVLLLAGGLAFASRRNDAPGQRVDVAAPTVETTTTPPQAVETPAVAEAPTTIVVAPPTTKPPRAVKIPPPLLAAYNSCADLLAKTKVAALAAVGPYGISGGSQGSAGAGAAAPRPGASAGASSGAGSSPEAGGDAGPAPQASAAKEAPEFSGTNVQERGVDEPDLVKTDGRRIVTVSNNTLRVSYHDGDGLRVAGSFELPSDGRGNELFLTGTRAIVFGSTSDPDREPAKESTNGPYYGYRYLPWSVIWIVDIAEPSAMRIVSTLYLEGGYRTARLISGRVRLVVASNEVSPAFVAPADGTNEAYQAAVDRNREIIEGSTADDWSPRYIRLEGTDKSTARRGRLCACDRTLHPQQFSGTGTVSVLTIDPSRPEPVEAASVQGAADIVYASTTNLYVTSDRFSPGQARSSSDGPPETMLHRFDITGLEHARYVGSAGVRGAPLNQFALSEDAGHLRVATTERRWNSGSGRSESESFVTVFGLTETGLLQTGQVGGLGRGEAIRSVRFLGSVGYVVTFRQTDPLYSLDLSNPAKPVVRGELKVPGYSAYLHPLPGGYLLGVGQDASDQGMERGVQASTYDVRSIDKPSQVDRIGFGERTRTEVEQDHRSFLYWPATSTVVFPLTQHRYDEDGQWQPPLQGAVALTIDGAQHLSEIGQLTHEDRDHREGSALTIRRSFVIGGLLYTVSDGGLLASDLGTVADRAWLPF